MTAGEWLNCEDPERMIEYLQPNMSPRLSGRKMRLFGLAACQRVAHLLVDPRTKNGLEVVERYADGLCGKEDLQAIHATAYMAWQERREAYNQAEAEWFQAFPDADPSDAPLSFPSEHELADDALLNLLDPTDSFRRRIRNVAFYAVEAVTESPDATTDCDTRKAIEQKFQAELLREVIGNPFRLVSFSPAWRTVPTTALARTAYEERRFEVLPLLADALEEAGCADAAILAHLRGPGPHVRGCFAVDLCLGLS